jgi:hypothetical protein
MFGLCIIVKGERHDEEFFIGPFDNDVEAETYAKLQGWDGYDIMPLSTPIWPNVKMEIDHG